MQSFKIHLPKQQVHPRSGDAPGFYGKLFRFLRDQGAEVSFQARASVEGSRAYDGEHFHFVHQGQVRQANVLNTSMSYFRPFWYADPRGVFAESSIAQKEFDPESVNPKWAAGFFKRMHRRFADGRRSKLPQPDAERNLGQGHVAVFLQGTSAAQRKTQYMEEIEMIEALLAGIPDRRILVKAHPHNEDLLTTAQIMRLAKHYPRLKLVEANVHDILQGACLSCSVSSSVSMEGLLHRVPALLFGRADFHHCAVTVEDASEVAYAYTMAMGRDWPFEAYLYWFLRENCLDERSDDWVDRLLERVKAMG